MACAAAGRAEEWERVGGRLVADPGKLLRAGWQPAIDTRAGLAALARVASPQDASKTAPSRPSV
jgi:UDP-glucose 4-epimerase